MYSSRFRTYETRFKSQVSVDLDGMSLCIWSTGADLGSGDSEVNRDVKKLGNSETLPVSLHCFLSLPLHISHMPPTSLNDTISTISLTNEFDRHHGVLRDSMLRRFTRENDNIIDK
jgi:hypothetical protein